jgi:branched-chain amino acid transport system permease protein
VARAAIPAGIAPRGGVMPAAFKDAALTALVAALLGLPLVGLQVVSRSSGMMVEGRFGELAIAVALIFCGRLGIVLVGAGSARAVLAGAVAAMLVGGLAPIPGVFLSVVTVAGGALLALRAGQVMLRDHAAVTALRARLTPAAASFRGVGGWLAPALIAFAVALPFLPFADRQVVDIGILVMTYVMLGWGLNIVVGLAGLLDLGYVAFYAVGAYSYALLAQYFGFSFWISLPLAGAFAAGFGILLGFPVLRLRGDYLAIVTLGFGEMVRVILLNWTSLTNGPDGISGVPRPSFFGLPFKRRPPEGIESFSQFFGLEYSPIHRVIFLYYLILILALITNAFTLRIRKLPIGRAWEALREDEIACRSLGINPTNTKLSAFAIGAMFGGFAGSFFATRQGFISPESFTFIESAIILAVVVLGGMGSQVGVVIAAIILIGLPEWFRELQEFRMLAFGAGMVLIMIWRPRGLLSHRAPTVVLGEARAARGS